MHVFDDIYDGLSPDEAILWVKPLDIVKVSYGRHDNATLRGDACYGSWNWLRPSESWFTDGEGYLMSGNQKKGLMIEATPMEELYVQFFAPITTKEKAGTTYKNLQAGFAYTVPGLVKVKGQYIGMGAAKGEDTEATAAVAGKWTDKDGKATTATAIETALSMATGALNTATGYQDALAAGYTYTAATPAAAAADGAEGNSNCALEAEVDVLAVEGLTAGVGFRYNVVKDGKDNKADKMKVALYGAYQVMPELKVSANGAIYMNYDSKVNPVFDAGAGIDYDLGDGLALNADFRYRSAVKYDGDKLVDISNDVEDADHIAFSVGVTKNVSSNGYIGVAFQGITNSGSLGNTVITGVKNDDGEPKNFVWAIPVALSVWF